MSQNNYLFNRAWSVTIGLGTRSASPGNGASAGAAAALQSLTPAKTYSSFSLTPTQSPSPLRITFDIDKGSSNTTNKGKIEIYNLSSLSRLLFQTTNPDVSGTGYQVQLQVGYASLSGSPSLVRNIFTGDIMRATNKRSGSDIVTTFECGMNEKDLFLQNFDKSYPAGVTLVQILQDLVSASGIPIGNVLGIPKVTYNYGVSVSGIIKNSLNRFLTPYGLQSSVQNNALQIVPVGAYVGTEFVVVSNQQNAVGQAFKDAPGLTGLIGVPSQNQGITQFSSLLNPAIFPGSGVQIFSENIQGQYFSIRRAHFMGDSHGDKWQVDCEAVPLLNPNQSFTAAVGASLAVTVGEVAE